MANQNQYGTTNITGVSGAQHGAQQNAQAMQQAAQKSGQFGQQAGAAQQGLSASAASQNPQLSGSNITGVSGAQHGAQQNAQAMQRAAQKSNHPIQ